MHVKDIFQNHYQIINQFNQSFKANNVHVKNVHIKNFCVKFPGVPYEENFPMSTNRWTVVDIADYPDPVTFINTTNQRNTKSQTHIHIRSTVRNSYPRCCVVKFFNDFVKLRRIVQPAEYRSFHRT